MHKRSSMTGVGKWGKCKFATVSCFQETQLAAQYRTLHFGNNICVNITKNQLPLQNTATAALAIPMSTS